MQHISSQSIITAYGCSPHQSACASQIDLVNDIVSQYDFCVAPLIWSMKNTIAALEQYVLSVSPLYLVQCCAAAFSCVPVPFAADYRASYTFDVFLDMFVCTGERVLLYCLRVSVMPLIRCQT